MNLLPSVFPLVTLFPNNSFETLPRSPFAALRVPNASFEQATKPPFRVCVSTLHHFCPKNNMFLINLWEIPPLFFAESLEKQTFLRVFQDIVVSGRHTTKCSFCMLKKRPLSSPAKRHPDAQGPAGKPTTFTTVRSIKKMAWKALPCGIMSGGAYDDDKTGTH